MMEVYVLNIRAWISQHSRGEVKAFNGKSLVKIKYKNSNTILSKIFIDPSRMSIETMHVFNTLQCIAQVLLYDIDEYQYFLL